MSCNYCEPRYEEPPVVFEIGIKVGDKWYTGEDIESLRNSAEEYREALLAMERTNKNQVAMIKRLKKKLGMKIKEEDEDE